MRRLFFAALLLSGCTYTIVDEVGDHLGAADAGPPAFVPTVMEFDGTNNVQLGYFDAPVDQVLGAFATDALVAPHDCDALGYVLSRGYGGAHADLFGLDGCLPTGNVWDSAASSIHSFSGFEGAVAGRWVHYEHDWDGAGICVRIDGVPVGWSAWSGTRGTSAGPTDYSSASAYVGGSNHINFVGRLAWLRAFEGTDPFSFAPGSCMAYVPERTPSLQNQLSGVQAVYVGDYTTGATVVPDYSEVGWNGHTHPGQPWGWDGPDPGGFNVQPGAVGSYSENPPVYVHDATVPIVGSPAAPAYGASPPPCTAKICDSFSRADSDYMWTATPSMGTTEGGLLGPLPWHTALIAGVNIFGTLRSDWGVFRGRAVNLDATPGGSYASSTAWVLGDSDDSTISVDRHPQDSADPDGLAALLYRVSADGSQWRAIYASNTVVNCERWNGLGDYDSCEGAPTGVPNPPSFTTLKVVTVGTTTTVYTDGNAVLTISGQTSAPASGKGAGLIRPWSPANRNLQRFDNFTVN